MLVAGLLWWKNGALGPGPIRLWHSHRVRTTLAAMGMRFLGRTIAIWTTGAALAASSCGSDDGQKKARCSDAYDCQADGGANDGGAASLDAGSPNGTAARAGTSGSAALGGAAGAPDGGEPISGSNTGTAGASAGSGPEAQGGTAGASALDCPVGTADCDDDPTDCETNTATDKLNCGRCDRVCGAAAACTSGLCDATVLLDPPAGVYSNWCGGTFSATKAYMITCWGNNNLSEVRTALLEPGADISGTRIRHYTNVPLGALRGILIDGGNVFYGLEGSPSNLFKFPLDATGTNDVTTALTAENAVRFDDLQLVGDTYYWEDNNHTAAGLVSGATVYKRSKTDVASTMLISGLGLAYNLQVTPTKLVFGEVRTQGGALHVYRAPLAGAAAVDLEDVATVTSGTYLRKQGDYVYWTIKSATPNGKLQRLKYADDTATAEDVVSGLNLPEGLASDEQYLYFKQLDALYKVPLAGGTPVQLSPVVPANDTQATQVFHVDDKYVYFAAGAGFGDSTLVRVAK